MVKYKVTFKILRSNLLNDWYYSKMHNTNLVFLDFVISNYVKKITNNFLRNFFISKKMLVNFFYIIGYCEILKN